MEPALFEEFVREFTAEVNRQRTALASETETLQGELVRVTRQIDKLVDAIIEGADALTLNAKLKELEGQKAVLANKLATTPDAEPLIHPALATIYRDTIEKLEASLRRPDTGREAFELVRGLIGAIILRRSRAGLRSSCVVIWPGSWRCPKPVTRAPSPRRRRRCKSRWLRG